MSYESKKLPNAGNYGLTRFPPSLGSCDPRHRVCDRRRDQGSRLCDDGGASRPDRAGGGSRPYHAEGGVNGNGGVGWRRDTWLHEWRGIRKYGAVARTER